MLDQRFSKTTSQLLGYNSKLFIGEVVGHSVYARI